MKLDILFELDSLAEIYDNPIKCAARDAAIEIRKLRAAIADTLKENGHLADGEHIAARLDRWFVEGLYAANRSACPYKPGTLAEKWWMRGCNHGIMIAAKQLVVPLAPERAVYRTQWAARLRTWADETRQRGRVFALVDAAECNLIAKHLEECTAELARLQAEGVGLTKDLGD